MKQTIVSFPASRGLLSGGTTQFISTPNILQYILTIVSTEDMNKVQLKIRQETRPKRYLKKFLNLLACVTSTPVRRMSVIF